MITLTIHNCRECPYFKAENVRDIRQRPSGLGGTTQRLCHLFTRNYGEPKEQRLQT